MIDLKDIAYVLLFGAYLCLLVLLAYLSRRKYRAFFAVFNEQNRCKDKEIQNLRAQVRILDYMSKNLSESVKTSKLCFRSQYGEDTYLWDIFAGKTDGFFVELGAADGLLFSNSYVFEVLGWRGLLVEPHPALYEACRRNRPGSLVVQAVAGPDDSTGEVDFFCAENDVGPSLLSFSKADKKHLSRCRKEGLELRTVRVPYTSLNSLLEGVTEQVDFLSLDVEGAELEVLAGFDLDRYDPRILLIESHGKDHKDRLDRYLLNFNYVSVMERHCNIFYGKKDDVGLLKAVS